MTTEEIPTRPVPSSLKTPDVETRYAAFEKLQVQVANVCDLTNLDHLCLQFLLVSAVDPKGKIVYRGTSSAGTSHHGKQRIASKAVPEGALAAKKTTEIAAMFSNIKLNQTTDIIIDDSEATEDTASELSTDDAYSSMRFRSNQGKNKAGFTKSMENSLGYLP